jgi:hypothetical protein
MSFRPMVLVGYEWAGNGLRFATKDEALANARNLMQRWLLVKDVRADESSDPVNYKWADGALVRIEENA